jgi:hypothetical protein
MALFNVPIAGYYRSRNENICSQFLTGGVEYAKEDRNIESRSLVL